MAPEVIENKQYTLKADVFSYGVNTINIDHYMGNMYEKNSLR